MCLRAWVSVEILWHSVLLPLLAVAGGCYRAQPLINVEGATKHEHGMTCATELFYLRHVRSRAAAAFFWRSIRMFRNEMQHMHDRWLGDIENHNGMLKMALQIPRLLLQLLPAMPSPMLQRTQLLLEVVPCCFIAVLQSTPSPPPNGR